MFRKLHSRVSRWLDGSLSIREIQLIMWVGTVLMVASSENKMLAAGIALILFVLIEALWSICDRLSEIVHYTNMIYFELFFAKKDGPSGMSRGFDAFRYAARQKVKEPEKEHE